MNKRLATLILILTTGAVLKQFSKYNSHQLILSVTRFLVHLQKWPRTRKVLLSRLLSFVSQSSFKMPYNGLALAEGGVFQH